MKQKESVSSDTQELTWLQKSILYAKRIGLILLVVWTLVSALGLGFILSNKDRVEAVSWGISNTPQTLQSKHLFDQQASHWLDAPKDTAGN